MRNENYDLEVQGEAGANGEGDISLAEQEFIVDFTPLGAHS